MAKAKMTTRKTASTTRNVRACTCTLLLVLAILSTVTTQITDAKTVAAPPILIGIDAAMTGPVGQSGVAIHRGLQIAIDEINDKGGVLGRKLAVTVRDNHGVPARGIDTIHELAQNKNIVAIVGGIHSPVALAELKTIHKNAIIYLSPWAAATPLVDNGYNPNYVFRISARDQFAGAFLIKQAIARGYKRPGLLLWRTGWGRSNQKAMMAAIEKVKLHAAGVRWFNTSQADMSRDLAALKMAGADVIMLVTSAYEGFIIVNNMADLPANKRLPIIAHWGMSGGRVSSKTLRAFDKIDYSFLQTYSFFKPTNPARAQKFMRAYCIKFKACGSPASVISPVGSAHAYDLAYLLKRAIEKAGTTDRSSVRDALEQLGRYDGLVRTYNPPFTKTRHDALDVTDFRLARYGKNGAIVPLTLSKTR